MTYKGNDTFRVAICGCEPGSEEMEAVWAGEEKHLKMLLTHFHHQIAVSLDIHLTESADGTVGSGDPIRLLARQ